MPACSAADPFRIRFDDVSAHLPDGRVLYAGIDFAVHDGMVALVGRNGTGKSHLLAQAAGAIAPAAGRIVRHGRIHWLPQEPRLAPGDTALDLLGLRDAVAALRRLLAGSGDDRDAALLDDRWTLETDIAARLHDCGLDGLPLGRPAAALSGGERQQLRLAGALLAQADLLLLDEPTNHLDAAARERWWRALRAQPAACLLVSHARDWLEGVDRILELQPDGIVAYGGGWSFYRAERERRRQAADAALAHSRLQLERERDALRAQRERQEKRSARARAARPDTNQSPLLLDARAENSERTAARLRRQGARRLGALEDETRAARARAARQDEPVFVAGARNAVPAGRRVVEFVDCHPLAADARATLDLALAGPVRVLLAGANGSGKTTLLRACMGLASPARGHARLHVPWARVDQHLERLPPSQPARDWLAAQLPALDAGTLGSRLALLGLPGERARRPIGTFSGGERMKLALAAVACAEPAPQLLLLDEPGNHLDLESLAALEAFLRQWPGALLLASHDPHLCAAVAPTHRIGIDGGSIHCEAVPPAR